jgi:ABC-type spermidine/putrescine transport system permease subunit II
VLGPAFRSVDERLERAAWSLGARPLVALWRVVLPPLLPSLLSAWLFAFLVSFDELVVTYFIAGTHETLPKRMFNELAVEITPMVTAVSTLLVALTAAALALSLAVGRRAGRTSPPTR